MEGVSQVLQLLRGGVALHDHVLRSCFISPASHWKSLFRTTLVRYVSGLEAKVEE